MSERPRLLVGQIWQESHSFTPVLTTAEDFVVERGEAVVTENLDADTVLGGILRQCRAAGAVPVPTIAARARPGGPVDHATFLDFARAILDRARSRDFDAVVLELHGALVTTIEDDAEGWLLAALRDIVGERVPIAVGLDLHAHMTRQMAAAADYTVGYKKNPHSDMAATGEAACRGALAMLSGAFRPVTAFVHLPFLAGGNSETEPGTPLAALHAAARAMEAVEPALDDISIFNVNPFIDAAEIGQSVVATSDGTPDLAQRAALEIAGRLWEWRDRFTATFPSIDETLDRVRAEPQSRPFVLGDLGDRVLAGAPGDGTAIIAALRDRYPDLAAAVPVTDAAAVAVAIGAGVGAEVDLLVGGSLTPGTARLPVRGTVEHLSDGWYTARGPYMAGVRTCLGRTAVVRVGRLRLVLTERAGMTQDANAFESQGIAIADLDLVVVKSGNHFKISFDGLATPVVVDTPGLSAYAPAALPFAKGRPVYPIDDVAWAPTTAEIFTRFG